MMNIKFITLTLICRKSKEIIDLDHQISFFHGKVSSGKSSIARLIDFCLGGELEKTPAITSELSSVSLELYISNNKVLIERDAEGSGNVRVSWIDDVNKTATVLAPIHPISGSKAIWLENIFSLSDLLFHLFEMKPLLIPSTKETEEAKLIRLSFRSFMWYCYLDQDHLDSSFFRLEDVGRKKSSKEIMKLIMQYSNQKLIDLEEELVRKKELRQTKISTAKELKSFLSKFGYSDISEIEKEIEYTKEKLLNARKEKKILDDGYIKDTHSSDDTRKMIKKISLELESKNQSLEDLEKKITEQESLKSELISTKFKIARTKSVTNILSGVKFEHCPQCGCGIKKDKHTEDECSLCGTDYSANSIDDNTFISSNAEIIRIDIDSRINDIDLSIDIHKQSKRRVKKQISILYNSKKDLEHKLQKQLKVYESIFLSNIREIDRKVATYIERIKGQEKLKEMPFEINKLEEDANKILSREHEIKQKILLEISKLDKAENNISDLENTFLDTLLEIGLPGVGKDDTVKINRKTWEVFIYPSGLESKKWSFSNAGSGGKKTLFNVCYLLSIHIVASKNNLLLPKFIIIDTPMKNIDKEVNMDLFKNFYDYLYNSAANELSDTQIILIDNSFVTPSDTKLSFYDRFMTDTDDDNPPLISYYRGA